MTNIKHDVALLWAWTKAHKAFGIMPDFKEFLSIRAAYHEPQRHYHTWQHIYECVKFVQDNYGFEPMVVLALFYHDVVYIIGADDNEEASAVRWEQYGMQRQIQNAIGWMKVRQISEMIVMTKKHFVDPKAPLRFKMMCDADMHIFLTSEERYLQYARDIWQEYKGVGAADYLAGRLTFLNNLDTSSLFYTHQAKKLLGRASANIQLEKTLLETKPNRIMV
jgi:predicted metal-dependent HD superfamily phosphohydrolase